MTERKCIDPVLIKKSNGRAICSKRFDSNRDNGCTNCSKISGFNRNVSARDGRTNAERAADLAILLIKEDGIRDRAHSTGIFIRYK